MATAIAGRLQVAITNANLATEDPPSLTDRPQAEDAGIRSKGHHSDPTADRAISGIGIDERVFELMYANVDTLELALANLVQFCERWAPVTTAHPRCNAGRDSVEEWARPDCQDHAGYYTRSDGSTAYRADGLCDGCRMRKSRHLAKQREDAA
jgi:hypothetical protein